MDEPEGTLIVVTGVVSSGKTTISREIGSRSSFRYFDGDGFLKAHPPTPFDLLPANLPSYTQRIRERMLNEIGNRLESENVVLDMILPAPYVERIRARFGDRALLALLTVEATEQQRREARRGGDTDPQRKWAASRTDLSGPDSLYDLVVDTTPSSPGNCAEQILSKARDRWRA
jgi:chloramphenicol 3-O-phosphotransferase